MATIKTAIELQDNFTGVMRSVIQAVNDSVFAVDNFANAMSANINSTPFDSLEESASDAAKTTEKLNAEMCKIQSPVISMGAQEIQNANVMLTQLRNTQSSIAERAQTMDIFSPETITGMEQISSRIQAIQARIQALENDPVNLGTDKANNELQQLHASLNRAVHEQQSLNAAVDQMDVAKANAAYSRLSNTIGSAERLIRENTTAQRVFNSTVSDGAQKANNLMGALKNAFMVYASFQTVKAVIGLSDDLTSMTARLDLMNDKQQTTEELQNMIYASAERSRGSYLATADAVSKLGLMAGDAFSSSEEIVAFSEQLNKQFTIAGTSAEGIDAAMLQLTQAMGSGILRGEEYNSVLEQAPNIIQAIADYMNVPKGQLKDMAAKGQITAEIVKNAMFAAAEETNAKFESMPKTFEQAWQSFENRAIMIFSPVLKQLNRIVNNDNFDALVDGIMTALSVVATAALMTFNLVADVGGFVADNWAVIAPIIYFVAGALGVYYAQLAITYALQKKQMILDALTTAWTKTRTVATALLSAVTGTLTQAQAASAVTQLELNAAMYACPITWIIAGIAALVAIFAVVIAVVNKFAGTSISVTGTVAGTFAAMGAYIANVFIGVQNAISSFVNFFANVFIHPIASAKILFLDFMTFVAKIVRHVMELIQGIVNIIPGVEIDITSQLDAQITWMQDEKQATIEQSGYKEYMKPVEYRDPNEVFNRWYEKGKNFSLSSLTPDIPNAEQYDFDAITNGINSIAENTGKTAANTEITEEDLKYLRDIAEQEVINRYTTAEINVDMSGMQNTVNNNGDLDGFVSGLTDAVNEAAESMAEGEHI